MDIKYKNVLVTGGAGFIGTNLVRKLLDLGASVVVIDDLFTGRKENLKDLQIRFHETSINEPLLMDRVIEQTDIIFHLAARNIIASTKSPLEDYQTNIGGTLGILLALKRHPRAKMVYASSASVYGNPKYLPINEDDHINLLTPYAVSKYAGEGYCMAFHESFGIPVTILRYSNVYGPYQRPDNPYSGVIAKFIDCVLHGMPITVHGDGLQTRDFTYVDDVVEATILAATTEGTNGEIFNVATGIETDIGRLAKTILALASTEDADTRLYNRSLGKKDYILNIDRRDIDNIRRRVLNVEKIRRKLRWLPAYNLNQGLERTIAWVKNNK